MTPVLEIAEIETDPQMQARNMIIEQTHPICGKIKGIGVPLKFSATPAKPSGPAPTLGKDTADIMKEIGYKPEEIETFEPTLVHEVIRMVDRNEYKRRQAPPGVKITHRALGKDRRLPVTNKYRNF